MGNMGTLLRYEMKKLFGRRLVWITLAVTLLGSISPVAVPLLGSYIVEGEKVDTHWHMLQVDRENAEKLAGRLIDQTLLEETMRGYAMLPQGYYIMTEEYQTYARPYHLIFDFIRANTGMGSSEALRWTADEEGLYSRRLEMLEQEYDFLCLSEKEKEFWRQKESRLEWPVRFERTEGWDSLFSAVSTLCFLLPLCLAVCLSGVFPEEHQRRTDQLILSSRKGRGMVYLAKLSAGVIFSVLCAVAVSSVVFLFSFAIHGSDGFHAAFQLLYARYSLSLTAGQAVLIMYGILVVSSVLSAVLIMVLSEVFHSSMAALATVSAYLILSMMVAVPEQYRVLAQLWNWLPGAFVTPWNIFDLRLLPVFGTYFTAWQSVPVLYLLAAAALAAAGLPVYRRYQVSGR